MHDSCIYFTFFASQNVVFWTTNHICLTVKQQIVMFLYVMH